MEELRMTSRDCLRKTLNHETPDRVVVDFGSTAVSGLHVTCVAELRDYYGLEKRPVKVIEPYQMLGEVDRDLRQAMGVDTVGAPAPGTIFGFRNENWKPFRAPWGQELLVAGRFQTTTAANGDLLIYPQGDMSVPPSGRMPAGGFFFDSIPRQEPLDEDALDPAANLEEFEALTAEDLAFYRAQAQCLATADEGVIGGIGGTALGDIALVPAPFLKHPQGIRSVEEWYMSTVVRQDYLHQVFAAQTEIAIANLAAAYEAVGAAWDAIFVCGTDFGTQTSSFCSPATFDELYAPYYKRMNDWIHAHTPWKTFKHSCGAVEPFMSHFIAVGFDIVNPVQCSAAGMDPQTLKARYGDRLVFWGGGINTQSTLPFGTPDEVRREVLERCAIFAPGGGFVFNAVHNVQAQTPVANIVAMLDAVRAFNGA
jgi:hypothetical protein